MNFLLGPLVLAARPPRDRFGPIIHFVIGPGGPIPDGDIDELPGLGAVFGPHTLWGSRTEFNLPKTRSGLARAARSGSCVRTQQSLL